MEDIVEYSSNVTNLIEGYSLESLVADKRTYYSVMKNVEVVGEAAYMLTKAFKKSHPEIPWKVVQGMRHVLVHDYAIHVHVKNADGKAKFDILPEGVVLVKNEGIKTKDIKAAEMVLEENKELAIEKWNEYFGRSVKNEDSEDLV